MDRDGTRIEDHLLAKGREYSEDKRARQFLKEKIEANQCTFSPMIGKRDSDDQIKRKSILLSSGGVHEFLYSQSKNKKVNDTPKEKKVLLSPKSAMDLTRRLSSNEIKSKWLKEKTKEKERYET